MSTRPPLLRGSFSSNELIVDCFAGAGGASKGIEAALGRPPDFAINHDPVALAVHQANHPETRHIISDIWEIDPSTVCGSRRVGLLWASPDCTHHSRAKGGKPRSSKRRALASVVIVWAREVGPRMIVVENVEEFAEWGPLGPDGKPDKTKAGKNFRAWCAKLVALGYELDFRSVVAADHGAPTLRKRLVLVARRDRAAIIWPQATHGPGRPSPWRTAAACINWNHPVRSIFGRKKPHAEATLRRIAVGVHRFVLGSARPFIAPVAAAHSGAPAFCIPTLIQTGYGERRGQAPRALDVTRPLGTVVAGGSKHALVAAFISKHYEGVVGHGVERPIGAITAHAGGNHALTTAWLTTYYGSSRHGAALEDPMPTVLAGGDRGGGHAALTTAFLMKYHGGAHQANRGQRLEEPLRTQDTSNRFALVTVAGTTYRIEDIGMRMLQPDELARAQGFDETYDLSAAITQTDKIRLIGNSVCPQMAEAIVGANARETTEQ